jgi:hypothetical protein
MIYFWAGHKRMEPQHLRETLANLEWSESPNNPHWKDEGLDEKSIAALVRATALRYLGETSKAREILKQDIMSHEWVEFKGHLRDSWTSPCSRYELACCSWQERDGLAEDQQRLNECSKYLEELAGWESYDLDARFVFYFMLLFDSFTD